MIKRRSDRKKVEREEEREERNKKRENRNLSYLLLHFPESLSSLPSCLEIEVCFVQSLYNAGYAERPSHRGPT